MRANLFNGWFNSLLTLVTCLSPLARPFPRLSAGPLSTACGFRPAKPARMPKAPAGRSSPPTSGSSPSVFSPMIEQWRPLVAMVLLVGLLFYSQDRRPLEKSLVYAWIIGLFLMGLLMKGGILGLAG
jgi:general L-amino acid transport system permease protein